MPAIFYQANFCAECGNPLEPRRGWRPRYFCDECRAQIGRRRFLTPLALFGGLLATVLSLTGGPPAGSSHRSSAIMAPPDVSARDATAKQRLPPEKQPEELVFCGARTRKGTPCRRRVRPGQRCAQHHGLTSMPETKHE